MLQYPHAQLTLNLVSVAANPDSAQEVLVGFIKFHLSRAGKDFTD